MTCEIICSILAVALAAYQWGVVIGTRAAYRHAEKVMDDLRKDLVK